MVAVITCDGGAEFVLWAVKVRALADKLIVPELLPLPSPLSPPPPPPPPPPPLPQAARIKQNAMDANRNSCRLVLRIATPPSFIIDCDDFTLLSLTESRQVTYSPEYRYFSTR